MLGEHLFNISCKDPTIFSGIIIHAEVKRHLFSYKSSDFFVKQTNMMLALADVTFEEHVFVLFRLTKDLLYCICTVQTLRLKSFGELRHTFKFSFKKK